MSYIILLLLCCTVSGGFKLTPSELAHVCHGQQLVLKCETKANYLRWNITFSESGYTDERLVTSYGIPDNLPLRINNILFNFTRISASPLVATMSILNVTTNLRIGCREYTELSTRILSTLVFPIRDEDKNDYTALEISIIEESFKPTGVRIILDLESVLSDVHPYSVSVSVVPSNFVTMTTNSTHAELTLPFNITYNISFTPIFCGLSGESSVIQLFYVPCGDLDLMLSSSPRHEFVGYHDPAVEGTSANFMCPLGLILSGPNSSTCMENGEWEPDPNEVECRANCGSPHNNHSNLIMTYNSTLEGSALTFRCQPGLIPNYTSTAVCHKNASWVPDPAQHRCTTRNRNNQTLGVSSVMLSHAALIAIISTLCISSCGCILMILTFGLICMKLRSSNGRAMIDGVNNIEMMEISPAHVYEAIVPKTLINQEEELMNKNIAYGPVYAVCK